MADGVEGMRQVATGPDWFGWTMLTLAVLIYAVPGVMYVYRDAWPASHCLMSGSDLSQLLASVGSIPVFLVSLLGIMMRSRKLLPIVAMGLMAPPVVMGVYVLLLIEGVVRGF